MYILHKSYYTRASWTQNLFFKAMSPFIDVETKAKIYVTTESTLPELNEIFHPC